MNVVKSKVPFERNKKKRKRKTAWPYRNSEESIHIFRITLKEWIMKNQVGIYLGNISKA